MHRSVTTSYVVQPARTNVPMPLEIENVAYFTAVDIQGDLGIARQTLWRWRKAGKIPRGRRYRDQQVVFTAQEVESIRQYANRLEPTDTKDVDQLKLFNAASPKGSE
jgi:hypothetical protein